VVHGPVKVYMINFKYILITLLVKHSILENPSVESFFFLEDEDKNDRVKEKIVGTTNTKRTDGFL
jgi:hypothetical protein